MPVERAVVLEVGPKALDEEELPVLVSLQRVVTVCVGYKGGGTTCAD